MTAVAVVLGTYNRLPLLRRAVASIRQAVGKHDHRIILVDGGSTDGTLEWIDPQSDITVIQQTELTGAVKAFNLGFGYAVDAGFDWIGHLNDDAEIITPLAIEKAIDLMQADPTIGEVAFEFNLWGPWHFDYVNKRAYANFGVIRREAGIAVAKKQGDPTGRNWWNPIYRHYGADSEFGVWLWKLGYRVHEGRGLRVNDLNARDELRRRNDEINNRKPDGVLFWDRWRDENWVGCLPPLIDPPVYTLPVIANVPADHRDPKCLELDRHRSNCDCVDRSPFLAAEQRPIRDPICQKNNWHRTDCLCIDRSSFPR